MKLTKVEQNILPKSTALIVEPKGPWLNLAPIGDRFFVTSPDSGRETPDMIGGVHLPAGALAKMGSYAEVTVESVGPEVKNIERGDRLLVVRPQCQRVNYLGNDYWWTTETAVMGIINRRVP